MKQILIIVLLLSCNLIFSQKKEKRTNSDNYIQNMPQDTSKAFKGRDILKSEKPSITLYKIYSLEKDTVFLDTTLSIQKEYKFNMLRKDKFGLLQFAN